MSTPFSVTADGALSMDEGGNIWRTIEPVTPPFPTAVRVGYRDYVIEKWESRAANERSSWGEHSGQLGVIRIDEVLIERDPVKAANSLLHELVHACWTNADLADEDKEERVVTGLANQLTQVWRDNPHVIAWINAQLEAKR